MNALAPTGSEPLQADLPSPAAAPDRASSDGGESDGGDGSADDDADDDEPRLKHQRLGARAAAEGDGARL